MSIPSEMWEATKHDCHCGTCQAIRAYEAAQAARLPDHPPQREAGGKKEL